MEIIEGAELAICGFNEETKVSISLPLPVGYILTGINVECEGVNAQTVTATAYKISGECVEFDRSSPKVYILTLLADGTWLDKEQ